MEKIVTEMLAGWLGLIKSVTILNKNKWNLSKSYTHDNVPNGTDDFYYMHFVLLL